MRIRQRHRALPPDLAEVDDDLRFPVMMSDRRITDWLVCTAWLIDHPERRILIDTGESADFGTTEYFGAAAPSISKIYPKIIDGSAAPGNTLPATLATAGHDISGVEICVLTHTHSDHVGNIGTLSRSTRILVSPEELAPVPRSGRLLTKLPQDGRIEVTARSKPIGVFGPAQPLTQRGDVFAVATPGHTGGHQSVLIELGPRRVLIAGDAAFDDAQVESDTIPGIVESRSATLSTYDMLRRARQEKPTLNLFTHDPMNESKLSKFTAAG